MLYGWDTWNLHVVDVRHMNVFDNPCLHSIARFEWSNRASNVRVGNLALGTDSEDILSAYQMGQTLLVGPRVAHDEHSSTLSCPGFLSAHVKVNS